MDLRTSIRRLALFLGCVFTPRRPLCAVLSLLPIAFAGNGFAQAPTISTYAGPPLPVSGTQAITQVIGYPAAVIVDGAGGFYVASDSQHRIYRVAADGTLTVIAGIGTNGFSGDGGPATSAQLYYPYGVAVDGAGNLFIADYYTIASGR